jgi:hypothetical protein
MNRASRRIGSVAVVVGVLLSSGLPAGADLGGWLLHG